MVRTCDSLYLTYNFGPNALKHVVAMNKPPKLRSASSHYLKILGKVKVTLLLGTYEFSIHVIVYEEKRNVLLLGSDAFYNRLIYDRGRYLAFADKRHKPIPIHYELTPGAIKSIIFTILFLSTIMLLYYMSQWTIYYSCIYFIPSNIYLNISFKLFNALSF